MCVCDVLSHGSGAFMCFEMRESSTATVAHESMQGLREQHRGQLRRMLSQDQDSLDQRLPRFRA